jgi:hypothetical protein
MTEVYITPITVCEEGLAEVIQRRFSMTADSAERVVSGFIKPHLAQLKNLCG